MLMLQLIHIGRQSVLSTPIVVYVMADSGARTIDSHSYKKSPIHIEGAFNARISGMTMNGTCLKSQQVIYVSKDIKEVYLSFDAILDLEIVHIDLPAVGKFSATPSSTASTPRDNVSRSSPFNAVQS